MQFRINRQVKAIKVRVIGSEGEQLGIMGSKEAYQKALDSGLDLVEIAPNAVPPVCKIMDYSKFRYDQTKKEKENKKAQQQIKVKEIKIRPNIDDHDLWVKTKQARQFLEKGNKVKVSCFFRGREAMYPDLGEKIVAKFCGEVQDISQQESVPKMIGKCILVVLAPMSSKKK